MPRAILAIASIALTVFALADCVQTDASRVRGIPKWAWIILVVLIPWVGPLTWLIAGKDRTRRSGARSGTRPGGVGPVPRRSGPLAPDEDPDFLRRLDEDIRRERRLREQGDDEAGHDSKGPSTAS